MSKFKGKMKQKKRKEAQEARYRKKANESHRRHFPDHYEPFLGAASEGLALAMGAAGMAGRLAKMGETQNGR